MKVILALIAVTLVAIVIVAGGIFAYGERTARISAERVASLENQARITAETAAIEAVREKIAAQQVTAQEERARAVAEDRAAEAEREKNSALQAAGKSDLAKATAENMAAEADKARVAAETSAAEAESARMEAERLAAEAEQARVSAEAVAAEAARAKTVALQVAERAKRARAVAERTAEEERLARVVSEQDKESAEQAQLAAERAAEQAERARKFAEQNASREEQARVAAERAVVAEEKRRVRELARTQPLIKAIISGELKFYIEPLPWYAGEGVTRAVDDVAQSFSSWSWDNARVRRVHTEADADLTVSWVRDYGTHVLGEAIFSSHVKVGLGSNNCGEWMAFDADTITKILWHELGHSMGYGHSTDSNNIMYTYSDTKLVVDREIDDEVIAGGWFLTIPLCGSGRYFYSFETEESSQGFDIFVLPPGMDPQSVAAGGGRVYTNCGRRGVHRFSGYCNVADEAKILIVNTSYYEAIRLSGEIIDRNEIPWPNMTWDKAAYRYNNAQLQEYYDLFH